MLYFILVVLLCFTTLFFLAQRIWRAAFAAKNTDVQWSGACPGP